MFWLASDLLRFLIYLFSYYSVILNHFLCFFALIMSVLDFYSLTVMFVFFNFHFSFGFLFALFTSCCNLQYRLRVFSLSLLFLRYICYYFLFSPMVVKEHSLFYSVFFYTFFFALSTIFSPFFCVDTRIIDEYE
jgi:hypothetical protein